MTFRLRALVHTIGNTVHVFADTIAPRDVENKFEMYRKTWPGTYPEVVELECRIVRDTVHADGCSMALGTVSAPEDA